VSAVAADAALPVAARLGLRYGLAELARQIWLVAGAANDDGPAAEPVDAGDRPSSRPSPRPSPKPGPRPSPRPSPHRTRGIETAELPAGLPAGLRAPGGPAGTASGGVQSAGPEDEPGDVWAIVKRAQNGDAEAFGEIYDRYIDTVFRYVFFRVGSRPLAEDLTSETFLRALRRIGSVTWQGRDLGAWLVTIARNLIADHYKSGRYRLEVATADLLDADREDSGPDGRPEAEVLERLTNATLLEAVKKLNPEQQECIVLRFLQGLSVTATAHVMGKNEGASKALQYRAVRSLGRLLPAGFTP
jgi:RNA polymerase sigma-70 factor (ECF subfamily)